MGTGCRPQERRGANSFRKASKPLMEKKRRARINLSLEQLRGLLETHYSHQIRKRKLEKADILELSVKYMRSLQPPLQGPPEAPGSANLHAGFLLRSDVAHASSSSASSSSPLLRDLARALPFSLLGAAFSTTDSGLGRAAEPQPVPLGNPKPERRRWRARRLQPQDRDPEGCQDQEPVPCRERSDRDISGQDLAQGQDRLPPRSAPLWRPWLWELTKTMSVHDPDETKLTLFQEQHHQPSPGIFQADDSEDGILS